MNRYDENAPFVPVQVAFASACSSVLCAEVAVHGMLPQPLGHGHFPTMRLYREPRGDEPVLLFATLDHKARWPDPKDRDAAPPTWANAVEGNWLIFRKSLVAPVLREAVAAGDVALRPAWLGRALAKRNGTVEPAKGRLDDDWCLLDVLARVPLDRDTLTAAHFTARAQLQNPALDPTRPHASLVSFVPDMPTWRPGREPRASIFRLAEMPSKVLVAQPVYRALKAVLGDAIVPGGVTYSDPLGNWPASQALPQSADESAASAEAFWRIHTSGGRGSDADRARAIASPLYATWLALLVDRGPSDATRAAALRHPVTAYAYARLVDRGPRDDTREAVGTAMGLHYAADVERAVHPTIRARHAGYDALQLGDLDRRLHAEAEHLATTRSAHDVMAEAEAAPGTAKKPKATTKKTAAPAPPKATGSTGSTAPPLAHPVMFAWGTVAYAGDIVAPLGHHHADARHAAGPWDYATRQPAVERRRLAKKGGASLVLRASESEAPIFLRSVIEPLLAGIPPADVTLRPVRLVDGQDVLAEDYVLLDVHARVPLDRTTAKLDLVDPARPETSPIRAAWTFAWAPGRVPHARLFRVAEFPHVLMLAPDLLAALRKATKNAVVEHQGALGHWHTLPALRVDAGDPPTPATTDELTAAAGAEAFWALYRGEGDAAHRRRALASPLHAFWLAKLVDGAARAETRTAALADPAAAALYGRWLDGEVRDDVRNAAARWPPAARYLDDATPVLPIQRAPTPATAPGLPPSTYAPTTARARAARRTRVVEAPAPAGLPSHAVPPAERMADVDEFIEQALELVGATDDAPPAELAARVHAFVDDVRAKKRTIPPRDPQWVKLQLAVLWSHQLVRALGWRWANIRQASGEVLGVVSPDLAVAAYPHAIITAALDKKRTNTTLLLFNMLVGGVLPPSSPGSYTSVG
jgi:hypothetical protein